MSTVLVDSFTELPECLLARIERRDCTAEEAVFRAYYSRLWRLAARRQSPHLRGRFGADDVAQSAMRTFFSHARKGEYSLPPGGDLWRLLAKITRRKLTKHTRIHLAIRRTVFVEYGGDDCAAADVSDRGINGPEEQVALLEELRVILAPLCEEYQQMVMLRLAGYTIKEIAAQVPCCERTVFRALERFEELAADRRKRLDAAE